MSETGSKGRASSGKLHDEALPLHGHEGNKVVKADVLEVKIWNSHDMKEKGVGMEKELVLVDSGSDNDGS